MALGRISGQSQSKYGCVPDLNIRELNKKTGLRNWLACEDSGTTGGRERLLLTLIPRCTPDQWVRLDRERYTTGGLGAKTPG